MKLLNIYAIRRISLRGMISGLIPVLMLGFMAFNSYASFNVYKFEDQAKEQQFKTLIKQLRCPKCQNNNIADSTAPLAVDIKNYVYKSIESGQTDAQITDFLVSRYGEFVTYEPRFHGAGILVWLLPVFFLVLAVFVIINNVKAKNKLLALTKSANKDLHAAIKSSSQARTKTDAAATDLSAGKVGKTMQEILADDEIKSASHVNTNHKKGDK